MLRAAAILSVTIFFICPAMPFPSNIFPAASIGDSVIEVRMTKSNVCKYKYKFKKAAQHLREKAHCK